MIKIYNGDVFSFDIKDYDRWQLLKLCWKNSKCSDLKFLVYDGADLIGAVSYQDVLADKPIIPNYLEFGEDLFARGREYFRKQENRQSCVPVLKERGGELMFFLTFVENKLFDELREGKLNHEFWDIDFDSNIQNLDFTLLDRASGFYFYELEEYTYELARLILQRYPCKQICFGDKMAEKFFSKEAVKIYESTWEFKDAEKPQGYLYINSQRTQRSHKIIPQYLTGQYGSIQIMESLLWCQKRSRLGNRNEGETVFLIDFDVEGIGLVDILKFGYICTVMAMRRGWLPVMKLDSFPNQYLEREGENMWEYFFCPVSDISVEDALHSASVVFAEDNQLLWSLSFNPYVSELHTGLLEEAKWNAGRTFNQVVRRNEFLEEYFLNNLFPEFQDKGNRVLGVVARGTDYKREISEKVTGYHGKGWDKDIQQIIRRSRECANAWNCNYIFVATEDEEYFQLFCEEFGEALLFVEQKRVKMDTDEDVLYIADKLGLDKGQRRAFAMQYLLVIHCLAKCNVLISNMENCGANLLAKLWNEGEYEYTETI